MWRLGSFHADTGYSSLWTSCVTVLQHVSCVVVKSFYHLLYVFGFPLFLCSPLTLTCNCSCTHSFAFMVWSSASSMSLVCLNSDGLLDIVQTTTTYFVLPQRCFLCTIHAFSSWSFLSCVAKFHLCRSFKMGFINGVVKTWDVPCDHCPGLFVRGLNSHLCLCRFRTRLLFPFCCSTVSNLSFFCFLNAFPSSTKSRSNCSSSFSQPTPESS